MGTPNSVVECVNVSRAARKSVVPTQRASTLETKPAVLREDGTRERTGIKGVRICANCDKMTFPAPV